VKILLVQTQLIHSFTAFLTTCSTLADAWEFFALTATTGPHKPRSLTLLVSDKNVPIDTNIFYEISIG
jgi:uncharacterized membrane protein (DUF4010 family)